MIAETQTFDVSLLPSADTVVVEMRGELDLCALPRATAAVLAAIVSAERAVAVDLRGLRYMDSSGIACLLQARAVAQRTGTRLTILEGSGSPYRILRLAGVDRLIEMSPDPDELEEPLRAPFAGSVQAGRQG